MGFLSSFFDMGRKNHKPKRQKQKQLNHQFNRSDYRASVNQGSNSYKAQIQKAKANKASRKENINEIAFKVFGGKYFCTGEHYGVD